MASSQGSEPGPYRAVRMSGDTHALCYCGSCGAMARLSIDGDYPQCYDCKATAATDPVTRPPDSKINDFERWLREVGGMP